MDAGDVVSLISTLDCRATLQNHRDADEERIGVPVGDGGDTEWPGSGEGGSVRDRTGLEVVVYGQPEQ